MNIDSRTKGQVALQRQWKIIFRIKEKYIKGSDDKKMVNPHVKIMTMRISVQDGTEYSLQCRWSVSKNTLILKRNAPVESCVSFGVFFIHYFLTPGS